jgi:predicted small secreted protein
MIRALTLTAVATALLLGGCAAMDGVMKDASNVGEAVKTATAPPEAVAYKAFVARNEATMAAVTVAMTGSGIPKLFGSTVNITYRDALGRAFVYTGVKQLRIPLPPDAIEAESKELAPAFAAIGTRMLEWNRTEPIELVAVSTTNEGAEFMVAQLKRVAPGLRVSSKVGAYAVAGYTGVELRMLSTVTDRQVK